jgi:hypothetical protein
VAITTETKALTEATGKDSIEVDIGADTGEIVEDTGVAVTETTTQTNKTKTLKILTIRPATNRTTARTNRTSRKRTTSTKTKTAVTVITIIAITITTSIPVATEVASNLPSKKWSKK